MGARVVGWGVVTAGVEPSSVMVGAGVGRMLGAMVVGAGVVSDTGCGVTEMSEMVGCGVPMVG